LPWTAAEPTQAWSDFPQLSRNYYTLPRRAEIQPTPQQFRVTKKAIPKVFNPENEMRQAEEPKTARLRARRLAKEAGDRAAAHRDAAATRVT
jgi:hypothetical protein